MKKFNLMLTNGEYEYIKRQAVLNHMSMTKVIRNLIIASKTIDMRSEREQWLRKRILRIKSKNT